MNDARTLVIYHTTDIHARLGFGAKLAAIVEPGSLLVDCGDALAGSSTVYRRREEVMREFAAAGYRAQAVGNREFHYLHSCMLARSRASGVPWVCSNLIDLRNRAPAFARELTLTAGAVRVRFLSVLAPQYRTGSGWERIFGWRFLAPEAALDELLSARDSSGNATTADRNRSDAVVLLSHVGLEADRALARRHPALTAIVGGHSHETLEQPEFTAGVPIVHSGPYARYAGRLELALDGGRARVVSYRLLPLLAPEPERSA